MKEHPEWLVGNGFDNGFVRLAAIVKDANKGSAAQTITVAAGAAAPVVTAFAGLDWKVAAVLGAMVLVGGIVALVLARPIYLNKADKLTDETARSIVGLNEIGAKLCGWKPPT